MITPDLRAAAGFDSGLAVGGGRRGLTTVLMALGSTSLVTGAAILVTSLAPYFTNPVGVAALMPRQALAGPTFDPSVVVAPTTPAALLPPPPAKVTAAPIPTPVDGVWFEIWIPAVGYRGVVRQGVGLNVLDRGPGHYPSTPWPGQPGNVGVAGHNTFWLSFSHLKPGDRVEIQTQHGLYLYEITGSKVVSPSDRTVLAATGDHRLTLTTCYPLWAGALATARLVFTAREIGGVA
ncbi:MAG: class D sortase [Candidatus Dormibacteraeota bacterium]|nr:class D sortase [Candidatus Dormibacteraeota bacterium]